MINLDLNLKYLSYFDYHDFYHKNMIVEFDIKR